MKLTPFYATHKRALLKRLRSMRKELDHTISLIVEMNPDTDSEVQPREGVERAISNIEDELYIISKGV